MFNQLFNSVNYLKLWVGKKIPIRKSKLYFFTLFWSITIISISLTFLYFQTDILDQYTNSSSISNEEYEQAITHHQTNNGDKRTIIFPNNFELSDNKLSDYYINNLEEALDPQDLIFRNKLTFKIPNDLPYTEQEIELFSAGSDTSTKDQCSSLSSKINVESSPVMNKNSDLKKILTKFMNENSLYYQEVSKFFPDLKQQLKEDTIDQHWYQLIGSSVWLKQYGVHLMISRIFYSKSGQKVQPVISLSYLQIFDRNWNELENVELIVPTDNDNDNEEEDHKDVRSFKPILYPQFAPMPVYHNEKQTKGRFYGVEDPRIQLITNPKGIEEPIIIYNSHHRKILKTEFENDGKGTIKFDSFRSIFMAWLWKTQTGKSNLEELPIKDEKISQMEYIKVKEILRPDNKRASKEKNWSMFLNNQEKLDTGFHNYIYFVYQFKNLKILKCSIYKDETCTWEYEADDYMGSGLLHGGSELVNIKQLIEEYDYSTSGSEPEPELESLLDKIPQGRELWVGFARAVLIDCGCGSKMYRPNLVVLMKDEENYKFSYVSSFFGLGIEILPWEQGKGLCFGKNLIIPNGISSWTITKDEESGKLIDYMAFTISRSDATVDIVHMRGLFNALLLDNKQSPLLNQEQQGFVTNTHVDCALKSSEKFCKIYSDQIKAKEEELNKSQKGNKEKEEEEEGKST